MEGRNFQVGKYIEKLENTCDNFFIRWLKTLSEEKSEQRQRNFKLQTTSLMKQKYIYRKAQKKENVIKNEKPLKQFIASKDEMHNI